jgi:WhiB family redox-sensing transcriptional regulator
MPLTRKIDPGGGWQTRALCAQVDPEPFFPSKGGTVRTAKWLCGRCPVGGPCLAYALRHGIKDGVWGGMTAGERGRLSGSAVVEQAAVA